MNKTTIRNFAMQERVQLIEAAQTPEVRHVLRALTCDSPDLTGIKFIDEAVA